MRSSTWILCLACAALLMMPLDSATLRAADVPHAGGKNPAQMNLVTIPGLPTCATGEVQSGDPTKGPSVIAARLDAGCTIPWHWHTPIEQVMMVSGTGRMEMRDGSSVLLQPGGYSMMPSKHVHQFSCPEECRLFVHSDGAFDIHYVDADGQELSPADALKRVGETAATPPPE